MNREYILYNNFSKWAKKYPDKAAITNAIGQQAGFIDFVRIYDNTTAFIKKHNIEEDTRIAVLTKDEISMSLMVMPVMLNATLIQLDFEMEIEQYDYYFNLLNIDYIITDDLSSAACFSAGKIGIGILSFEITGQMNSKRCTINLKTDLTKISRSDFVRKPDVISVTTTSGTTSTPKIVPTSYDQYAAAMESRIRFFDYTLDDTVLIAAKLYKTTAMNAMLTILNVGGSAVVCNGFTHSTFMNLISDYKVTTMTSSPAVLSSYSEYVRANNLKFTNSSLRFIRASGAPLSRKLKEYLEGVFQTPIEQSYGMTETKNISCTYRSPKGYKEGSAGISSLLDIKVLNGEILVKGATVFDGYENSEVDNSEYFTDGWFHTGDLGFVDEDGYIFITGRIKEMINKGGEKISPYEVESAILRHSDISDAAVFPCPNSYGSEDAGAVIVVQNDKNIELENLRKFLLGKISAYKMPSLLYIVKEIPKSKNDKVQRKMLYNQLNDLYPEQGCDSMNDVVLKQSNTEKKVRKIWVKTLKRNNFKNDIAFTELGGDSLNGAVVLSQIERDFNIRVPVNVLFSGGTVKSVAEYIDCEEQKDNRFKFLVPIKPSGSKKPLICVHSGAGDAVTYRHIGINMEEDRPVYALRFTAKNFKWPQPLSFDDLSREYINEIRRFDPEGPYFICGNCWGGVLAYRIASMLIDEGCTVGMIALFDAATKNKKAEKIASSLFRRMKVTILESLDQLKGHSFKKKLSLIFKKAGNIINLVKITQNKKLYGYGLRKNNSFLMKISGKTGALGYAYSSYSPEYLNNQLYYFKATQGMSGKNKNEEYWKSMVRDFEMIEMACHHNAMVVGEDSKVLTDKLSEIIEEWNV